MKTRSAVALSLFSLLCICGCGGGDGGGASPSLSRGASPSRTPTLGSAATATPTRRSSPMATVPSSPTRTSTPTNELDIGVCAPGSGAFSIVIDNPFLPLPVGAVWVLVGEADGVPVQLEATSLDETEIVGGVTTRVLQERHWEDGELVEVSRNYLAQNGEGTVCYFGEDVDIFEAGAIVSHDGAWRAGANGARAGIVMPASPHVGQFFKQEDAPGVAEDQAELVAAGQGVSVGLGTFTDTIRFRETSPLEPGSTSEKIYARGVGLLVDDEIRRQ